MPGYFTGYYPDYFTGYYPGSEAETSTNLVSVVPNDSDIFIDILDRLESLTTTDGTRIFDAVQLVESPDTVSPSSDWQAYAAVWFTSCDDLDDAMSGDTPDIVRRTKYGIRITVATTESDTRLIDLSRLVSLIKPVLNNTSLGSQTLPGWTRLRQENRTGGAQPQGVANLVGEFAVLVYGDDEFSIDFQE